MADPFAHYPANPAALKASIEELDAWLGSGVALDEVENQTSFGESLMLALHELKRLQALSAERQRDSERLDFLDRCNAALNARYGTHYGWELILNHNITRLMLGRDAVDLNDAAGGKAKLPSCRAAIDARMTSLAGGRVDG
ncbi:MAG: hypothetical protein GY873_30330 [Bosea sp.]|uniref:hypothetical protein n=1 Tax=Bosea sp. (in: a-proteobacteria) TaxID=1871050 RepID=UPI0023A09F1E|nr:hypothetical protein [Bosea sp. (in: a-proteobacteria)]MCP4738494.1 hypothetical protein [Bosea sp. (in: a-proteobacteria)]